MTQPSDKEGERLPAAQPSEREAFEAWARANDFETHRDDSDKYRDYHRATTRWAWQAWQARALLSEKDAIEAARYRWLRDGPNTNRVPHVTQYPAQDFDNPRYPQIRDVGLDAAIDSAMGRGRTAP